MSAEVDPQVAPEQAPDAGQFPAGPPVRDHLREIRTVKRWTRLIVYPGVTLLIPLGHFLWGLTWQQALFVHLGGYAIGTVAIEFAFAGLFKLRKRSAYPGEVFLQLSAVATFDAGCQAAVTIMDRLVGLRGSFLALHNRSGFLGLVALSTLGRLDADRYLRLGADCVERVLLTKQVAALRPDGNFVADMVTSPGQPVVFVPVQSFHGVMGILGLLAEASNPNLRDAELLISLGYAIGVSLENLRQRDELRTMAAVDELTRVYNRHYFFEQLEREFAAARRYESPVSVLIFDLDGLKGLNDRFGHESGDEALRVLAQRLVRYSRASDIVARLGGDEFAVILSRTDCAGAAQIARRLQSCVEGELPAAGDGRTLRIAVSCGLASFPEDGEDASEILRQADGRMYAAKAARSGPGRKRRK